MGGIRIEAILPPRSQYSDAQLAKMDAEIERTLRGPVKDRIKRAMQARVTNWRTQPQIVGVYSNPDPNTRQMYVYPRAGGMRTPNGKSGRDLWIMISGGTKGKLIVPKKAKRLRVRHGYNPKTMPSNVYGLSSSYSGGTTYPLAAPWPGIKARNFEDFIAKQEGDYVKGLLEANIKRVI